MNRTLDEILPLGQLVFIIGELYYPTTLFKLKFWLFFS
jgi:hypothetical protein